MSRPYRLTGVGALRKGGRWNVQNLIPALNFGETPFVVAAEIYASAAASGWKGTIKPHMFVAFDLKLNNALDLTDPATLATLQTTSADLTSCDWLAAQAAGAEALTQAVARAAFETLCEGLIVPSARYPGGKNMIMFPAHLQSATQIIAQDESKIPFEHGLP